MSRGEWRDWKENAVIMQEMIPYTQTLIRDTSGAEPPEPQKRKWMILCLGDVELLKKHLRLEGRQQRS